MKIRVGSHVDLAIIFLLDFHTVYYIDLVNLLIASYIIIVYIAIYIESVFYVDQCDLSLCTVPSTFPDSNFFHSNSHPGIYHTGYL